MAAVVCAEGLKLMADALKHIDVDTARIKLFKNSYTFAFATLLADLTIADFSGYAEENPGAPVVTWDAGTNQAVITFPQVTFTHNGGGVANDVYGWWIEFTDPITSSVVIAMGGNFDSPLTIDSDGDVVNVQPVFRFKIPA